MSEEQGIDWSKKDMYEGIGRPDLRIKLLKERRIKKENKLEKLIELFGEVLEEFDQRLNDLEHNVGNLQ
ncbi:hypothetical protein ES708_19506 [subsurface metagenome]